MSDYDEAYARLPQMFGWLREGDPNFKRFGAAQHRYELLPPLTISEAAQFLERICGPLPEACRDYFTHVTELSAGGAGPYYGLFHPLRAAEMIQDGQLPLAHFGCGYFVMMPLDGPESGQIVFEAKPLGIRQVIHPSFSAFYLTWSARMLQNQWPDEYVPAGACALQAALSGYLLVCEERLGLGAGQLTGPALREALGDLGPGAIQIAAEGPLFNAGDIVDPCIVCARVIENLAADGLAPDAIAPGVPALPQR